MFPLWGAQSEALIAEFINLGYKTIIACTQDGLQDFCGQVIDSLFVTALPSTIDCCGENGEFHTFVFDGPLFNKQVKFELGERVFKTFPSVDHSDIPVGYWYVDLI